MSDYPFDIEFLKKIKYTIDKNEINEEFLKSRLLDTNIGYSLYYNKDLYDIFKLYNDRQDNIGAFMSFLKEKGLENSGEALANYYYFLGHFYFDKSDLNVKVEEVIKKFIEVNKDYPQNNFYLRYFVQGAKASIIYKNGLYDKEFKPIESPEEEIVIDEEIINFKDMLNKDISNYSTYVDEYSKKTR